MANNTYLVFIRNGCTGESFPAKLMTAGEIFRRMDMSDCSDEEITEIYRTRPDRKRKLEKVTFHGTWHNWSDPLLMTITDSKGRVLDAAHGTDH